MEPLSPREIPSGLIHYADLRKTPRSSQNSDIKQAWDNAYVHFEHALNPFLRVMRWEDGKIQGASFFEPEDVSVRTWRTIAQRIDDFKSKDTALTRVDEGYEAVSLVESRCQECLKTLQASLRQETQERTQRRHWWQALIHLFRPSKHTAEKIAHLQHICAALEALKTPKIKETRL